jgi:hypothetical protein
LVLALSQEVYEYLEELDEMNWSARGNVLNQYLRNTSIGTTVRLISTQENFRQKENFVKCDLPTQIFRRKKILKLKIFDF